MSVGRAVALVVGGALLALLVAVLPARVAQVTYVVLTVAASVILLLVAAALFIVPARRLQAQVFSLPLRVEEGRWIGMPRDDEMRTTLSPLVTAGVCLGVVLLSRSVRDLLA